MAQNPIQQFGASDGDDRRSRFAISNDLDAAGNAILSRGSGPLGGGGPVSLRERAASQPPRSSDQNFLSSPSATHFIPSSLGGGTAGVWPNSRLNSTRGNQPVPMRSSSFSSNTQSQFSTVMRDRTFPSMIEDDEESDAVSETYDDRLPSIGRGRSYGDPIRSRSQSLATASGRPAPIGSGYPGSSTINSWNDSFHSNTSTGPLAIPGRFGDIKPPGQSRYGSLGTLGRSPVLLSSSPSANLLGSGLNSCGISDTNQSPFRRDVGQILLDDGAAFREIWSGANPTRDENGGGGSGTTSRRHSVSVVQPRKGIVGFSAPLADDPEEPVRSSAGFGRGNLRLTDDDLLADFGTMNLGSGDAPIASSSINPPSQPASLPIYAPLSRTPPSRDLLSPYQSLNTMGLPGSYSSRPPIGTPSDSEFLAERDNRTSPSGFDQYPQYGGQQLQERFISGQGLMFPATGGPSDSRMPFLRTRGSSLSSNAPAPSPISPSVTRLPNPPQQPYYAQQLQRMISEPMSPLSALYSGPSQPPSASTNLHNPPLPQFQLTSAGISHHQQQSSSGSGFSSHSTSQQTQPLPNINELGKGVPLHSVPVSCPLFIVEFKAGRTDLFYLKNLNLDIKTGDLVIVEADRGKDLGRVVNDTITISEVEDWQRQQAENAGGGSSGSPGASAAMNAAAAAAAAIGFGLDAAPGSPTTPGGSAAVTQQGGLSGQSQSKKEINPKEIHGKADHRETQCVCFCLY